MKTFWKALGITALAASLIPYRVHKDHETDTTVMDALLWQAVRRPSESEDKNQLNINIGFKSPLQAKRDECALFADDEPEAAVVTTGQLSEEPAETTPETEEPIVTEADFDPEA